MSDSPEPRVARRRSAGETLEQALSALYGRDKERYMYLVLGFASVVTVLLVIPISAFLCFLVIAPPWAIPHLMSIVFLVSLVTAPPIIFGVALRRTAIFVRWCHGSDEDPVAVWRCLALELPTTVLLIDLGCGICVSVPGLAAASEWLGDSPSFLLEIVAIGLTFLGSLAFWLLAMEVACRPGLVDLGRELPRDFRSTDQGRSMRSRQFFVTLMLVLFTEIATVELSTAVADRTERLAVGLAATVLMALTVSGFLAALLRHSILSRIDYLKSALQAVRAGRYDVRIVPVVGDEMDEVGEAFNDMVDRLVTSEQETKASRARIVAVADEERRRMERDLHDGAQQYFALLGLQLSSATELAQTDPQRVVAELAEMKTTLTGAQAELRNLAHGIYPASLETEGVAAALREAAARATVPVTVASDGVARLPREVEAALYFVCLEALQNVSKYAGAGATATVQLSRADHGVEFTVTDTGVGFDVETKGHGLVNMQDRIGALGGEVTVSSAPGAGTTVGGWVPVVEP